jgi:ParB family transcriptional regulator, chromosome partitioning protein
LLTWQSFVATRLPLLKKPPEILAAIRSSQIDYTKAVEISKLKNLKDREVLLEKAIVDRLPLSEVKQHVKALLVSTKEGLLDTNADLKLRFRATLRHMDKAKVWADSEKLAKLKELLEQIEQLVI